MEVKELITKVKANKKYKSLSNEIVEKEIRDYIKKNPNYELYKEKNIISQIRAKLHKSYARFQVKKKNKREKYLKEKDYEEILKTNLSTKERLSYYEDLYGDIFNITGNPKTIVDLGAGINPCSYPLMNTKAKYYSYDIDEEDADFLNRFFKLFKIKGEAETLDLREMKNIKKLPKADVCFMFKLLDVLEGGKGHKLSEDIIKNLKCKYVVVSFPTKTISGKAMKHSERGWINRMLDRIELKYNILRTNNEIYYIIEK